MIDLKKELIEIRKFIEQNHSGYFISIQLPLALKSNRLDITDQHFKYILSKFEKHLQGGSTSWIKHLYNFIGFYENRFEQGTYHLHILGSFINPLTNARIPIEEMHRAMEKANNQLVNRYDLKHGLEYDIQIVNNMPKTSKYCTKELIYKGFVDSDRITTAAIMFDPHKKPHKRLSKARQRQKQINNMYSAKARTRSAICETLSTKYPVMLIERSQYRAWSQYKTHAPTEYDLQQKAENSRRNKIRIQKYNTLANICTDC